MNPGNWAITIADRVAPAATPKAISCSNYPANGGKFKIQNFRNFKNKTRQSKKHRTRGQRQRRVRQEYRPKKQPQLMIEYGESPQSRKSVAAPPINPTQVEPSVIGVQENIEANPTIPDPRPTSAEEAPNNAPISDPEGLTNMGIMESGIQINNENNVPASDPTTPRQEHQSSAPNSRASESEASRVAPTKSNRRSQHLSGGQKGQRTHPIQSPKSK